MTNTERAEAVYTALEALEFDLDKDGFIATIAGSLDQTEASLESSAPALLAALTEGIGIPANEDFADDLETMAGQLEGRLPVYADRIRAKAQAIRAAIAATKGG